MRLDCPSCAAGFEIDPAVLGLKGRTVRCASCKTKWFAAAPEPALAESANAWTAETPSMPVPAVTAEDRADHEVLNASRIDTDASAIAAEDIAVVENAPALAPEAEEEPAPAVKRRKLVSPPPAKARRARRIPLAFVAAVLFCALGAAVMGRHAVVRAAPEMASLYAAIGLPVNLRGLEFQNIRTKQEIQDGVTVLSIEGDVENVANRAVELPRVRLAVIGDNGNEIYSWTALLPRSILYPHERVPFKSRLASPPAEGKEIMVRFLTRGDLTAQTR
jgi:predicted Zn finger-like uncharacterized protein